MPLQQQMEMQDFLRSRLERVARVELVKRGILDYKLIVEVAMDVVDADNIYNEISTLPDFYADDDTDQAAATIADLKRQLKVREQAYAKLKRANSTLSAMSATNKELVHNSRCAEDQDTPTDFNPINEAAAEEKCSPSNQAKHDLNIRAEPADQADTRFDPPHPDSLIDREPLESDHQLYTSEDLTSGSEPQPMSCLPGAGTAEEPRAQLSSEPDTAGHLSEEDRESDGAEQSTEDSQSPGS